MDLKNRIIVALDVDTLDTAVELADQLMPHVGAFKVGLELISSCGAPQTVSELATGGAKIFYDGKFKDIPDTVAAAVRAVTRLGVWMLNVHCMGGRKMMEEALSAAEAASKSSGIERPMVLGVTVLTSMDDGALRGIGVDAGNENALADQVVRLAELAKSAGLDGVIASPKEITLIREACGSDFKIVTPGVRPTWAAVDDQRRITTPAEAIGLGADYIVIGRPITRPPADIGSPVEAAKKIAGEINSLSPGGEGRGEGEGT